MNLTTSDNQRSSNLDFPETGFCRCGRKTGGRGSRGFCSDVCRFWSRVQKGPGCWLWTGGRHITKRTREPYGEVYYKGRPRRAHIVSWALAHGYLPPVSYGGMCIMHLCDTPLCVRPDHLKLGSQLENMQDAARKGRLHIPRPGRQKVTPDQIDVIRARVAAGETHKAVARHFGISRSFVSDLVRGATRPYDAPLDRGGTSPGAKRGPYQRRDVPPPQAPPASVGDPAELSERAS